MIRDIHAYGPSAAGTVAQPGAKRSDGSFAKTLKDFIHDVDSQLKRADGMMKEFAVGKRADLHNVMIETEKADLSLRLLLKIRNKLVEAYQEIMRMQV